MPRARLSGLGVGGITINAILASCLVGLCVALLQALTPLDVNPVAFLLPLLLAAILTLPSSTRLTIGQTLLGGLKLVYQRFGYALALLLCVLAAALRRRVA